MKQLITITIFSVLSFIFYALPVAASSGHGGNNHSAMEPSQTKMDNMDFKHEAVVDGVRTEFQIMSLSSMNMTDEKGATHHVMVKLLDDGTGAEIKSALGRIKVIGPAGSEQEGDLTNYGGILAANFSFPEPGKYGIICLFKSNEKKRVVKFWYHHKG